MVIISRFLINLRRTQAQPSVASHFSQVSSLSFRVVSEPNPVRSMGQPLDIGWYEVTEEVVTTAAVTLPYVVQHPSPC